MKPNGIVIDERFFVEAASLPPEIQDMAVSGNVDYQIMNGAVFLDAEQMIEAIRRNNKALEKRFVKTHRQIIKYAFKHPFLYGLLLCRRTISFLFGF